MVATNADGNTRKNASKFPPVHPTSVQLSTEAREKLDYMAQDHGLNRSKMLTVMIEHYYTSIYFQ